MLSQLFEFVGNHWILFVALIVISALLIHNLVIGEKGSIDSLGATDLINKRDAAVVDVRSTAEFAKGHIINSVNVPLNGFSNQTASLGKFKERPVVIVCQSGSRSQMACGILRKQGFAEVYNLRGGILAWENANLPLTRKKS